MKRSDVPELQCIAPLVNLPSILDHGLLSYALAADLRHISVADHMIQDRRSRRIVTPGRRLHEYANLYFNARNAMMWRLLHETSRSSRDLCVLRISTDVLDLPGVMVADRNAATDDVVFQPMPTGLQALRREIVYADRWKFGIGSATKQQMMAEALIPDQVDCHYIIGLHVSYPDVREMIAPLTGALSVAVTPRLFFLV